MAKKTTPEVSEVSGRNTEAMLGKPMLGVFEDTLAIQMGKAEPYGYEETAKLFRENPEKIKPYHHIWLYAEAEREGRLDDARTDFPRTEMIRNHIIQFMEKECPEETAFVKQKVANPNYKQR